MICQSPTDTRGCERTQLRRRRFEMPDQPLAQAAVRERRAPREHVIRRAAERIDVAADVGRGAVAGLLRGHVIDGADRAAFARDAEVVLVGAARRGQGRSA